MLEMFNFFSARSSRILQLVQMHFERKKPRINAVSAVKMLSAVVPCVGMEKAIVACSTAENTFSLDFFSLASTFIRSQCGR